MSDIARMVHYSAQSFIKDDDNHSRLDLLKIIDDGFILFRTLLFSSSGFGKIAIRTKLADADIGETIKEILVNGKKNFDSINRKDIICNAIATLHYMCENIHAYDPVKLNGRLPIRNDEITNKLFLSKKYHYNRNNAKVFDMDLFKAIAEIMNNGDENIGDEIMSCCVILMFMSKTRIWILLIHMQHQY